MAYDMDDIAFETQGPLRTLMRRLVTQPLSNYLIPSGALRWLLAWSKSDLAAANWDNPGGWRSMVISYDGNPRQFADRLLVNGGAMSMALRNRRRLAGRVLADLIDACPSSVPQVLCVGAGPGIIILDAVQRARKPAQATLVDLNDQAHEHARSLAKDAGLADRFRYVSGDIRSMDLQQLMHCKPDIVKLIGICEYLEDAMIVEIAQAVSRAAGPGCAVVFNSLSTDHGSDRFFRRVFGLHMIHRTPAQLQQLLGSAGFGSFETLAEPMGVYHVCIGRKDGQAVPGR